MDQRVIRGLPREMSVNDIKEDLVSQGIADAEVQQMTSRTTKKPLPLFLVKTKMPEKLAEIQRLAMLTVSFERKKKSSEPSQCYRCQRYGHTQRNCRLAERCVKCGEDHSSTSCSLPAPPTGQRKAKVAHCSSGGQCSYTTNRQTQEFKYLGTYHLTVQQKRIYKAGLFRYHGANNYIWGWQLTSKIEDQLKAVEMDVLRRSCRVSSLDYIRNDMIRARTFVKDTMVDRVERRQLVWYGLVMRMADETNTISLPSEKHSACDMDGAPDWPTRVVALLDVSAYVPPQQWRLRKPARAQWRCGDYGGGGDDGGVDGGGPRWLAVGGAPCVWAWPEAGGRSPCFCCYCSGAAAVQEKTLLL
ncbi:unnamed protein product [Acanthoscelides obtectus]|uniref:CCHC-type domain-containing protein n=1 Tax=Acanthoscelides obtectus TaxID=200917 RepID=A0A9P0PS43_ACAOB|nr:unnamed protein product [Acanthoscelides obtectus]CAK1670121.1 hypothetical protein AOBTE_LOCUS27414 [Acanthoscelides obtectus]